MNREEEIIKALAVFKPSIGCEVEVCVAYAKLPDCRPATPWHSVKDGELPQVNKDYVFSYKGFSYIRYMREDKSLRFNEDFSPMIDINEVEYWMEIPELPTE